MRKLLLTAALAAMLAPTTASAVTMEQLLPNVDPSTGLRYACAMDILYGDILFQSKPIENTGGFFIQQWEEGNMQDMIMTSLFAGRRPCAWLRILSDGTVQLQALPQYKDGHAPHYADGSDNKSGISAVLSGCNIFKFDRTRATIPSSNGSTVLVDPVTQSVVGETTVTAGTPYYEMSTAYPSAVIASPVAKDSGYELTFSMVEDVDYNTRKVTILADGSYPYYDRYVVRTYKDNSTASWNGDDGTDSWTFTDVPMRTELTGGKNIAITNFLAKGCAVKFGTSGATATFGNVTGTYASGQDGKYNVTLPRQEFQSALGRCTYYLSGNLVSGKITESRWFLPATYDGLRVPFYLGGATNTDPVTGTITPGDEAQHDAGTCPWVSNGGTRTTAAKGYMELDAFTMASADPATYDYTETTTDWCGWVDMDATLSVGLKLNLFGAKPENGVYVNGAVINAKNTAFVDNYEVYMIPGNLKSYTEGTVDADDGLQDAMYLGSVIDRPYATDWMPTGAKPATDDREFTFNYLVPADKIVGMDQWGDATPAYTFFLKANYANPDLTPTFHALTYRSINVKNFAGVNDITADDADSQAPVIYYNLQGQIVDTPTVGQLVIKRQGSRAEKCKM